MGADVPEFGIITSESYAYWLSEKKLPPTLIQQIFEEISSWETTYYAVRSSMQLEDGAEHSFAGMLDTFLYVTKEEIEEKILACFSSLQSDRINTYFTQKKIVDHGLMSVVIQKMVDSEISGVCFSRNPVGHSGLVLIESGWGLGEGIVSGKVEVDQFLIDRFGGVVKADIREKLVMMNYENKKVSICSVPESDQNIPSLNSNQVQELFFKVIDLEKKLMMPADIEWSYSKLSKKLYILQIRPITQKMPTLSYYADTNLSESYPGICSPFTCSLIPKLYENVFTEVATRLGARPHKLLKLKKHYKKVIREFSGHLYYDLSSYYSALSVLPGGEKNIVNWHRMIGGKIDHVKIEYEPLFPNIIENFFSLISFIKLLFFNKSSYDTFYNEAAKIRSAYQEKIIQAKTPLEVCQILLSITGQSFGFGLTAINDLLIMSCLSIFEKCAPRGWTFIDTAQFLRSKGETLESLKPQIAFHKIIDQTDLSNPFFATFEETIKKNPELTSIEILKKLESVDQYKKISNYFIDYLRDYGDRSFEELKFESPALGQSAENFLIFIKWNFQYKNISQKSSDNKKQGKQISPSGIQKFIGKKLLHFIAHREHSRFVRGQFYGLIRKCFYRLFEILRYDSTFKGLICQDYFSATISDFENYSLGKISLIDLATIMETNKHWRQSKIEVPEFYAHDEKSEPYFSFYKMQQEFSSKEKILKGDAASVGVVEGIALVISDPNEAFQENDLSQKILVTKNTDPAWVFIMSKCRGLISEKGSLLSHTAIIGRELSIPTVVGAKNATKILQSGQKIRLNGNSGTIEIL